MEQPTFDGAQLNRAVFSVIIPEGRLIMLASRGKELDRCVAAGSALNEYLLSSSSPAQTGIYVWEGVVDSQSMAFEGRWRELTPGEQSKIDSGINPFLS